ncbi:MAG: hypothetical protein HC782_04620 [Gammaproteobacteria bacterium]|nr:hypothetical protein [Gammaproteobacteria bacterium]
MGQPIVVVQRIANPKPTLSTPPRQSTRRIDVYQSVQDDCEFIQKVNADYSFVVKLFGEVIQQAKAGRWALANAIFQKFRAELNSHFLPDGVNVYDYMSGRIDDDADAAQILKAYELEMGNVGKTVFAFFDRYRDISSLATRKQQSVFLRAAISVANALAALISRKQPRLTIMRK